MADETTGTLEQTPPAETVNPSTPPKITSIDQIPQELRNQLEATHRKGLQKQIAELTEQNKTLAQLRDQSTHFMDSLRAAGVTFDEESGLAEVAETVNGTLENLKSEQERLEAVAAKQKDALAFEQQRAQQLQSELEQTLILHSLQGYLGQGEDGKPRCVSPKAAELIAAELAKRANPLDKDRKVTFKMEVVDPESDTVQTKDVDAATAVTALEANKEWQHFFTATVNAGAGGGVVDDVQRGRDGTVDFNALAKDPAKYFEIMQKNPGLITQAAEKQFAH